MFKLQKVDGEHKVVLFIMRIKLQFTSQRPLHTKRKSTEIVTVDGMVDGK